VTRLLLFLLVACAAPARPAPAPDRAGALRGVLERLHATSKFPGAVAAAWFASDNATVVAAVGEADRERHTRMPESALLHAGSAGKTFFAALVLQLVGEGRLALDAKVSTYLGGEPWYAKLPNADAITIRMLLQHTSGLPEWSGELMQSLVADPGRARTPLDAVTSLAGQPAAFPAGTKFGYTDVNYQLLQLVAEHVTGAPAYAEITRRILAPHQLADVVPADRARIAGLVPGYAGTGFFLGFDAVLTPEGDLRLHPGFEGGGGGFVTSAADLARWLPLFVDGKAYPAALVADVRRGVPAGKLDIGDNARSGLGVEIVDTPLGTAYGHGGFFPGYLTLVLYYPQAGISLAIQVNSSAEGAVSRPLRDVLLEAARALGASNADHASSPVAARAAVP